jgi:hypothetical protein
MMRDDGKGLNNKHRAVEQERLKENLWKNYLFVPVWLEQVMRWKRNKGVWGMPWLPEATKDVVSCEKLRGGANNF